MVEESSAECKEELMRVKESGHHAFICIYTCMCACTCACLSVTLLYVHMHTFCVYCLDCVVQKN